MPSNSENKKHKNDEKTVECPACGEEVLARGLHLHVMRSSGNGHGPHMEVPEDMDLKSAEEVGTREVEMDYPEERDSEDFARLCPYCERPYRGKHGVMIHLGQLAGRKDHPHNATEEHDPEDFPIVEVDEDENVVEVVEEPTALPATEERQEAERGVDQEQVRKHIQELRDQGLEEQAKQAEEMLLDC